MAKNENESDDEMRIEFWAGEDRDKKLVPVDLFCEKAKRWARKIYTEIPNNKTSVNNISQIRKFYDEVLSFDARLYAPQVKNQDEEFEKMLPYIRMLNAKAAYALARNLVSVSFRDFIKDSLGLIKYKDDFDVFKTFFEAFMGYYKYCVETKGKGGCE